MDDPVDPHTFLFNIKDDLINKRCRGKPWLDFYSSLVHLLSRRHVGVLLLALVMIIVPSSLYFVYASWIVSYKIHFVPNIIVAITFGLSVLFLCITALMDPGYLPQKRVDPLSANASPIPLLSINSTTDPRVNPESVALPPQYPFLPIQQPVLFPPADMEMDLGDVFVKVKYCRVCHIWRPPRASHCHVCDRCIDMHDHHCPWTGNCVGKRNYRFFVFFVLVTWFHAIMVWVFCLVSLIKESQQEATDGFQEAVSRYPVVFFLFFYALGASFSLMGLGVYHLYLVSLNATTREKLKHPVLFRKPGMSYTGDPETTKHLNPYSRGCLSNWYFVLCRPIEPTLVPYVPE